MPLFYGSMLKSNKILFLAHLWLNQVSSSSSQSITGFSQHTITSFYAHFRRLVASTLEEEHIVIGGQDIIVEVDETKLGRRKYNRGHRVEGVWVVVGVERTEARRVFLVAVEDRSAATLSEIIRNHVLPGSIVHTDLWRGYSGVEELGLEHRTVNHFIGFIDEETGVHTNTVEGTNHALKLQVPIKCRSRNGIDDHLLEFMWRRKHAGTLWNSFIAAIRDIHYDLQ
jgi:transposase-like protein